MCKSNPKGKEILVPTLPYNFHIRTVRQQFLFMKLYNVSTEHRCELTEALEILKTSTPGIYLTFYEEEWLKGFC